MSILKDIPCNVITGFLGSGKTTAILQLLKQKPEAERWAVLVNESGEIGIDGNIIASQGAVVKEIPGGCMCCSAGMPMQVALNTLIKESRPNRLLIEPTGIGHPRQILKQLMVPPFNQLLDMRACITLLDPRQLQNSRYRENCLFQDQIYIADVLVANKIDQCDESDQQYFIEYIQRLSPQKQASGWVQQGQLDRQWLDLAHQKTSQPERVFSPLSNSYFNGNQPGLSWKFDHACVFNYQSILLLITQLKVERLKALLKTDKGDVFINSVNGSSTTMHISELMQSSIEIIHHTQIDKADIGVQLTACII